MDNDITGMLNEVNMAIKAILLGGQSYTIGRRTLTRADLGTLRKMRAELMEQQAAEAAGASMLSNTFVAIFDGR